MAAALAAAIGQPGCGKEPADGTQPQRVTVAIKGHTWTVEIADTPETQRKGLADRAELPAGTGMLFVYDQPGHRTFWMQGVYIPLDIAFIDSGGRIVRIHTMKVEDDHLGHTSYHSRVPAQYALEVPGGAFERLGIVEGDTVALPDTVRNP